jgi:hypothetical protein
MVIVERNNPKQRWNEYVMKGYLWVTFQGSMDEQFRPKPKPVLPKIKRAEAVSLAEEFSLEKTFDIDLLSGDFRTRSTDLQSPGESEPHRELDIHFSASGERFLDYMAF